MPPPQVLTKGRLTGDERRIVRPGVHLGAAPACAANPRPHSSHQPSGQENPSARRRTQVLICTVPVCVNSVPQPPV